MNESWSVYILLQLIAHAMSCLNANNLEKLCVCMAYMPVCTGCTEWVSVHACF